MAARTKLVAASLSAIVLFYAFGALAANPDVVYQTTFSPRVPILGSVKIRLQNDSISPILIYGQDLNGKRWPLAFSTSRRDIIINANPVPFEMADLFLVYSTKLHQNRIDRAAVFVNNIEAPGEWDNPEPLINGVLTDVVDSLSFGLVGVADTHSVSFTVNNNPISDSGAVWIIFPSGFDISNVDGVLYSDNDTTNDGEEYYPIIESVSANEHSLLFQFAPSRQQASPLSRINLKFWPVINDTVAQSYTVIVMTTNRAGEIDNDPAESQSFNLVPESLDRISINPDTAMTLRAGAIINFTASGTDIYNNPLPNLLFDFNITTDSCGNIAAGAFQALKLGSTYVTVSALGLTDSSGLITVIPGPLDHFNFTGYPSQDTAGRTFRQNIVVEASDAENNRKYDYYGLLWFNTGDNIDDLPFRIANPDSFTVLDSGRVEYPGAGFSLKRAGIRYIHATNGSIEAVSPPIRVFPAAINSFRISTGTSHTAGESFPVLVDSALDAYGNLTSGEVVVSDSTGGGSSPGQHSSDL